MDTGKRLGLLFFLHCILYLLKFSSEKIAQDEPQQRVESKDCQKEKEIKEEIAKENLEAFFVERRRRHHVSLIFLISRS